MACHKVKEALDRLRDEGWVLVVQRGSHRQFKHPARAGRVTVAGQPRDDLPAGTWKSICRQANWEAP